MTKIAGSGSGSISQIRIQTHWSEGWIRGSGFTPKCHGSGTLPAGGRSSDGGEVIYSASAPGFTRSSRAGEAVDVSDSRTPAERFDMEEQRLAAAGSGLEEEDEEGLLTGKS
jgi:hypothetical protein